MPWPTMLPPTTRTLAFSRGRRLANRAAFAFVFRLWSMLGMTLRRNCCSLERGAKVVGPLLRKSAMVNTLFFSLIRTGMSSTIGNVALHLAAVQVSWACSTDRDALHIGQARIR